MTTKKKLLIGFGSLAGLLILFPIILWLNSGPDVCALKMTNLTVSPTEVAPNETVTITAEVRSICHVEMEWDISLKINGISEQTQYIVFDAGETKTVSFSVKKDMEGSYSVRLGRLQGVFEVIGSRLSTLMVHFIDVGQGDSILLDLGDTEVLIDGGDKEPGVVGYIDDYVDGSLEVMVATHPHAAHIGGLIEVLTDLEVDEIWLNGDTSTSQTYSQFMSAVNSEGAMVYEARRGDTIQAGDLTFNVLHPVSLTGDTDNDSIILSLSYGEVDFLFAGDAEEEAEGSILVQSVVPVPDVEILKVGHHGSSTASSMQFLQVAKPECAIYMAAEDNTYGHPHEETITNLCEIGAEIYGTDIHGTIVVTTDGVTYSVFPSNDVQPVSCPSDTIYDLTISTNGQGTINPTAGTYEYDSGTQVTITVSPAFGWKFDNWTGDVSTITDVNAASTTITVNDSYSITANFKEVDVAPDFTLLTMTGANITLSELKGTPVVINFWSISCYWCRKQLPYLENVAQQSVGEIEVVAINIIDSAASLEDFFAGYEPTMIVALDRNRETFSDYCIKYSNPRGATPFTLFLDSEGIMRYKQLGAFPSETALCDTLHDVFGP